MTSKLLALLLSTLILACPFNCMQEGVEGAESAASSCCSHCRTESNNNPLIPQPTSSDCCQCLCTGAIFENSSLIDLALQSLVWGEPSFQDVQYQLVSLSQQYGVISIDAGRVSGREIRCLQMSFQC